VGGRPNLVDLENCPLAAIAIWNFPGMSAQKIDVVEASVVVAPIGDVFDGARPRRSLPL